MFARRTRLALERLDDRNAPSSLIGNAVATTDWLGQTPKDDPPTYFGETNPGTNLKPVIVNFSVVIQTGNWGVFTGTVQDENPGNLTVTLTGAAQCVANGVTVTTDASGNFVFEAQLRPVLDGGKVYADVSDAQGLAADSASYLIVV